LIFLIGEFEQLDRRRRLNDVGVKIS